MRYPFLTILSILLLSLPAQAYDVDIAHVPLTNLSLSLYNNCFPASTLYRESAAQNRLVQGNRGMDTGKTDMLRNLDLNKQERAQLNGASAFNLTKRVGNWHFYNPDRASYSRVGLVEMSHLRLWQELKDGLASNSGKNALLFLGGLIHLTEDISVPAHAIPVYHGPTEVEVLGPRHFRPLVAYMRTAGKTHGGMIKDPIDGMAPDMKALSESLASIEGLCSAAGSGAETPEEIRDALARAVYGMLSATIPGCTNVSWGDFWIPAQEGEYFGRYNIGNKQPLFGERGTIRSSGGIACEMLENDERYAAFVLQLHRAAVMADMKLLTWGERQLGPENK